MNKITEEFINNFFSQHKVSTNNEVYYRKRLKSNRESIYKLINFINQYSDKKIDKQAVISFLNF